MPRPGASGTCQAPSTRIAVWADRVVGSLPKFWRCTGFTPAELLLLPEMRQTLSFLGAIPNRGIEFVRFAADALRQEGSDYRALSVPGGRYDRGMLENHLVINGV